MWQKDWRKLRENGLKFEQKYPDITNYQLKSDEETIQLILFKWASETSVINIKLWTTRNQGKFQLKLINSYWKKWFPELNIVKSSF